MEERKSALVAHLMVVHKSRILNVLAECSTMNKALMTIVWCVRWSSVLGKCREASTNTPSAQKEAKIRFTTQEEWSKAKSTILRLVQREHFSDEIKSLETSKKFSKLNRMGRYDALHR